MATLNVQRTEGIREHDWRFAEFVMRTWIDPELVELYNADPCGVLAEFGIHLRSPEDAPELRMGASLDVLAVQGKDQGDVG